MKNNQRLFIPLLAILLVIQTVPVSAIDSSSSRNMTESFDADNGIVVGEPDEYYTDSLDPETIKTIGQGEMTLEELSKININDVVIPECISQENAKSREHVNRLCSQEKNLNTVVFQNRDGSKTAYIFTKPVKYLDQDNSIKDKSTVISHSSNGNYSYAMENNSVRAFFPEDISKGVLLQFNGYSLTMSPVSSKKSERSILWQNECNKLAYSYTFDSHTDLQYTTLFSGIKEDIIIKEYSGQTRFCFSLQAERLIAQQSSKGKWQLINEKGEPIFYFENIYISDSNGKETLGVITVEPDATNQFFVYIDVPENFMSDPTTQYPVYVDPTVTVNETISIETENGSVEQSAIIDVGIFASYDDYCAANGSTVLNMGTYDEDICKIIYKFPVFYNDDISPFFELNRYRIGSAVLNINYLSSTSVTVVANPMTDTYSDTIDPTHLYDPALIDAFSSVNSSSTSFSSSGLKQIGITDIVKGWADYLSGETTAAYCDPQNGLLLSLSNSNAFISVASTEYSSAQNNVYLTIDYSDVGGKYYLYNLSEYKLLCNDSSNTLSLNTYSASNTRKWSLEYLGNDKFYIRSVNNPNYVLYGNGSSVCLQQFPSTQSERNKCKWVILTATGGGVIIKNDYSGNYLHINGTSLNLISPPASGTNAYDLCRWGILETKKYNGITNLSLSDDWIKPGTSKYLNIKATPANASWKSAHFFTWTISDTSVINSTSDIGRFSGVSSGKTTLTLSNKLTGYTKSFTIACGTIREGTYMILNKDTGRYMDVEGPSYNSGAYIQQWDYHAGSQEKWEVTLLVNGDYIIESLYSHKYLRVENGSTSANAKIIQYSDYNWTSCRWKIEDTASGAYKIIPMLVSSFAVSVPLNTNSNGTDLVQLQYSNDSNYRDEWIFDNIGETHGIDNGSVYTIEAVHSGKVITANAGGESNGTNVCQQSLTPGYQWQRWKMLYQGNGEYKIQDMQSGNLLSISASSATSGANAHIWADDGTTGQFFKIKENVDGSYAFLSKCSYYTCALNVNNNSISEGANVNQYNYSGGSNQSFWVAKHIVTIDFIAPCINMLCLLANGFAPNETEQYRQQLVLQYIRRNSYNSILWQICAGAINADFITFVDSHNSYMKKVFKAIPNEYPNEYVPTNAGGPSAGFIWDYNGELIDFYHLCATLNAMIYCKHSSNLIPLLLSGQISNLAGWAGDLISTVPDALNLVDSWGMPQNYQNVYSAMYSIMSSGGSGTHFSREDYLADIDAVLIFASTENLLMGSFEDHFENHFNYNCRERFTLFSSTISYSDSVSIVSTYLNYTPIVTMMLYETSFTSLSQEQKNAIKDSFVDYFWECVDNEQQ